MRNVRMVRAAVLAVLTAVSASAAESQIVVVSSSVDERDAAAGTTYTGEILVRNEGGVAREVRIYQSDYLFHADGRTVYAEPGSHARSNAKWLTVSPAGLTVPAGETAEISYTVAVPAEAPAGGGTYWSMIMIEPVEPLPPVAAAGSQPEVGLRTVVRFGIQIATHTDAATAHSVEIGRPNVTTDTDGTRSLVFEVQNGGAMAYRPVVSLEVYDSAGQVVTTLEAQRGLIYPGTSVLQSFDLTSLQPGTYEALVVVDTGSPDVFGGQFTVTISPGR